jgi:peptidoglycan hydrolase-like protein with peptidoglycan-binding domain
MSAVVFARTYGGEKMRKLILTTASVLALGIGALDAGHAAAIGGPVPNAAGDEVRQAQQQLRNLGLYRGPVDGIVGPGTERALQRFQMSNGLAVTATLDPQTMARLLGAGGVSQAVRTPPSSYQATAAYSTEQVQAAQQRLRDLGLYHGAIDGVFGPQTRQAVERFQTISGLAVTAALDQQTMNRLVPGAGIGSSTLPRPVPSGR